MIAIFIVGSFLLPHPVLRTFRPTPLRFFPSWMSCQPPSICYCRIMINEEWRLTGLRTEPWITDSFETTIQSKSVTKIMFDLQCQLHIGLTTVPKITQPTHTANTSQRVLMAFSITYPLVWQLKRVVSSIYAPTDPHKKWGSTSICRPRTWKSGGVNWPPGSRGSAAPAHSNV